MTAAGANEQDLRALAYLAQRLRTETAGAGRWDDAGLWPVLAKLKGHNLAVTIERVTRHAADPDARTPAAIERPFVPDAPARTPRHPPRLGVDDECPTHVGEYRATCRGCNADTLAGTDPPTPHDPPDLDGLTGRERFRIAREELDLRAALTPNLEEPADA